MRQFPKTLTHIIQKSETRLNVISKTSGVSHAYLTKLVTGHINRPGKDKVASILLSLNYAIARINEVLAEYDYQPLSASDIPEILANNRKRKIEGGILPQFDHIYFEMLMVAMERIGGVKILVKNRPSGIFIPNDMYLQTEFPFETEQEARRFHHDLTLALVNERKALFVENCRKGYRFETYICRKCLEDYCRRHLDPSAEPHRGRHRASLVRYFANAVAAIRRSPAQHRTTIVERCTYFHFQIQNAEGKRPKVSFPGRKIHHFDNQFELMNLEGFTTDAPAMLALFEMEADLCRQAAVASLEANYPDRLIAYIVETFAAHGLGEALSSAVEELLAKGPEAYF